MSKYDKIRKMAEEIGPNIRGALKELLSRFKVNTEIDDDWMFDNVPLADASEIFEKYNIDTKDIELLKGYLEVEEVDSIFVTIMLFALEKKLVVYNVLVTFKPGLSEYDEAVQETIEDIADVFSSNEYYVSSDNPLAYEIDINY